MKLGGRGTVHWGGGAVERIDRGDITGVYTRVTPWSLLPSALTYSPRRLDSLTWKSLDFRDRRFIQNQRRCRAEASGPLRERRRRHCMETTTLMGGVCGTARCRVGWDGKRQRESIRSHFLLVLPMTASIRSISHNCNRRQEGWSRRLPQNENA